MPELQSRLHIALVIRHLSGRNGGAERIYCELANILSDFGYNVTCLHFDKNNAGLFYSVNDGITVTNLCPVKLSTTRRVSRLASKISLLPTPVRNWLRWKNANGDFVAALRRFIDRDKPNIIISLMPPANTPTLIASRGHDVKVIVTNHNVPSEDYNSTERWDQNPLDKALRLKMLQYAHAIHVLFPSFAKWFPVELQAKIVAIPNYISPQFKDAASPRGKKKVILAVGRISFVKNYLQLLRSWSLIAKDFPDWQVAIYGDGPQRDKLKEEIKNLGLGDSVKLEGVKRDLGPVYAEAAIFCHPAHYEGFGLAPAEALHFGVPVIAYEDCEGINQFLKNEYNALLVQRDCEHDQLAEAMRKLMECQELREMLGRNGPSSVERFSLDEYKTNWRSLIERTLISK